MFAGFVDPEFLGLFVVYGGMFLLVWIINKIWG